MGIGKAAVREIGDWTAWTKRMGDEFWIVDGACCFIDGLSGAEDIDAVLARLDAMHAFDLLPFGQYGLLTGCGIEVERSPSGEWQARVCPLDGRIGADSLADCEEAMLEWEAWADEMIAAIMPPPVPARKLPAMPEALRELGAGREPGVVESLWKDAFELLWAPKDCTITPDAYADTCRLHVRFGLWDYDNDCGTNDAPEWTAEGLVRIGLGAIDGTWPDRVAMEKRLRDKAEQLYDIEKWYRDGGRAVFPLEGDDAWTRLYRRFGLPYDGSVDARSFTVDELVAKGLALWEAHGRKDGDVSLYEQA